VKQVLRKITSSDKPLLSPLSLESGLLTLEHRMNFKRWKVRKNNISGKISRKLYDIKGFQLQEILLSADNKMALAIDISHQSICLMNMQSTVF